MIHPGVVGRSETVAVRMGDSCTGEDVLTGAVVQGQIQIGDRMP